MIAMRVWFCHNDEVFYLDVQSDMVPLSDNYAAWRAIDRYDEQNGTHWMCIITEILAVSVLKDDKPDSDYGSGRRADDSTVAECESCRI